MRGASKTLVAALVVVLLAIGFAACGGGDDSGSTAVDAGQGQSEGASQQEGAKGAGDEGKSGANGDKGSNGSADEGGKSGNASGPSASDFVPKPHKDSGGGSGQFIVKGGDNSVQEFGAEADTTERNAAAVALHNFLDARAEGNWAASCGYLAKVVIESFEKLSEQAKGIEASGCSEILEKLTNPAAAQSMKVEAEQADVGSLRIEDEQSFVIYTGIDGTVFAMPMVNEDGVWKVGTLAGTPLS